MVCFVTSMKQNHTHFDMKTIVKRDFIKSFFGEDHCFDLEASLSRSSSYTVSCGLYRKPLTKINLIHQEADVVSIVEKENDGGVFNAVCPYHPSRKTYYATIAKEAGIELPPFLQSTTQNRRIISEKIQKVFDIKFNVENLLTLN